MEQGSEGSRVPLPAAVKPPLDVYINGVRQESGRDYAFEAGALRFTRSLKREGRLGFWRWLSMTLGLVGTYRDHETVDVIYDAGGVQRTASNLAPQEPGELVER